MSLNFNFVKIKDYKNVCWIKKPDGTERMNPITDAIIWACLSTDHGGISVTNFREFFYRLNKVQGEAGGLLFDHSGGKPEPVWITLQDVERHIGLQTNCTNRTRRQWAKKQGHPEWAKVSEPVV